MLYVRFIFLNKYSSFMKKVVRVFVFCLFGMLAIVSSYGQEPVSRVDTTRQSQEEIQEMYIRYASLVMSKHAKERKEYTAKAVIMPVFGFGASQLSGGIMVGYMARMGGYVKLKSGLTSSLSTGDLECDKGGYVEGGDQPLWFTGNKHKSRFAATAGVTYAITKPVFAYVGVGYGNRTLAWETTDGGWAKVSDYSFNGVEVEAGAIAYWERLAFSVGVQTNSFKYLEGNIGIGVIF